jgi:rhamnulokinase
MHIARWELHDTRCIASRASGEVALLDPDHPSLLHGGDVSAGVASWWTAAGQPPPADLSDMVRAILTSLACKYRLVLEQLSLLTGRRGRVVRVVVAGVCNELLCQLPADLLKLPLLAGPDEATAVGNVLVQARYEPSAAHSSDETYERFLALAGLESPRPARAEGVAR